MRYAVACLLAVVAIPCRAAWVREGALSDATRPAGLNVSFTTGDFLADGSHAWVAGHYRSEDGLRLAVFRTVDGGARWVGTYTDIAVTPATVLDFVDANRGWLLAGDSAIYRTEDAGRSWEAETIQGGSYSIRDLCMTGPAEGFAAGRVWRNDRAAVFEYRADERDWRQTNTGPEGLLRALAARSPSGVWTAGQTSEGDYLAWRWRTGATRWLPMSIPSSVRALSFPSGSRGWAACTSGRIFATEDEGVTWREQRTPVLSELQDILFCSVSSGMALSSDGDLVLVTSDGGTSWEVERAPENSQCLLFDGSRYLLVTLTGLLSHSTPPPRLIPSVQPLQRRSGSGPREIVPMPGPYVAPWRRCRSIDEVRGESTLRAACFLDDNRHAWVLASDGRLLRTRNAGASWERLTVPREVYIPRGIAFADNDHGWLFGGDSCIWRTRDGGATWETEAVDGGWNDGDFVAALEPLTSESGAAAVRFSGRNRSDLLWRVPESGVWTITGHSVPWPGRPRLAALGGADPRVWLVWMMSSAWQGLRTHRQFPEMERMTLGTGSDRSVRSLFFLDPVRGWAAADTLVFRTDDGGRTWEGFHAAGGDPANYPVDLAFDSYTHGYLITRLGQVLETEDGGENWRRRYESERPNLISVHRLGRRDSSWWVLAEDGLYTNAPAPGPPPALRPAEPAGRVLARALLVWSDARGWAGDGVRPDRGIAGREALFGVRWDRRNAEPPADLRLFIRAPGGALQFLSLRPVDYFAAQEGAGGADWGVAYTPPVAGEYAFRFVGSDAGGHDCNGEPTAEATWHVE
ncbi:MAG: WD40/YVTN/BNR-like repeat-containing protein [Armatimonadota bacterium]